MMDARLLAASAAVSAGERFAKPTGAGGGTATNAGAMPAPTAVANVRNAVSMSARPAPGAAENADVKDAWSAV